MPSQTLELIIGAVLPPVIDLVNRYIADTNWRYVVSLLLCLAIGVVTNIDKLTVGDVLGSGAIVFAAAQTAYKTYWKNSDARVSLFGKNINK